MKYIFYPFELLGDSLRSLSLTSSIGNVIAIVIYCLISLIPCMIYLWLYKKKKNQKIDYMLPLLSIVLFFTIYYLINPTLFMKDAYANIPDVGDYMLIGLFYSLTIGYLVTKGINYCTVQEEKNLQKTLIAILYIIMGILVVTLGNNLLVEFPKTMKELMGQNLGNDIWDLKMMPTIGGKIDMGASMLIVFLQQIVKAVPVIFEIIILFQATKLIHFYEEERYSKQVSNGVERISGLCMNMLKVTVWSNVFLNIIQILVRKQLFNVNIDLTIPMAEIAMVLGGLLITRYVHESQKLKEENDMFI